MKIKTTEFDGTPEEFNKVSHLFKSESSATTSEVSGVGQVTGGGTDSVADKVFELALTRAPLAESQRGVLRALAKAGKAKITRSKLAEAVGYSPQQLDGLLGALGRRINNTDGAGILNSPGITLFADIRKIDDDGAAEWHYELLPVARGVLKRLQLI